MPKITITGTTIKKAKADAIPGAKQSEIADSSAQGLVLRIGASGVSWQLRFEMNGTSSRLTLGSVDEWSIADARELAAEARKLIRGKIRRPDDAWVQEMRVAKGKVSAPATPQADPKLTIYWTFAQAREEYLEDVKRTKAEATYDGYRKILRFSDLNHFDKRPVASITRRDMSAAIAKVHKSGREASAEHVAAAIKPFWKWLALDDNSRRSGVDPGIMAGLLAPARSRRTEEEHGEHGTYVPAMREVGRIVAIARSGALHPVIGHAIELAVFSAQRRRQVVLASVKKMERILDGAEGLWSIPAPHRKTAIMRGDRSDHVIPLPSPAWSAVKKAIDLGDDTDAPRVFPQIRPQKSGGKIDHLDEGSLTKALAYMPGVEASPHDLRRAFATHGQRDLGFSLADVKAILDHNEGRASGDVTATVYALHDGSHYKWPIMRKWADHVEAAVRQVQLEAPGLLDVDWLREEIKRAREIAKGRRRKGISLTKPSGEILLDAAE